MLINSGLAATLRRYVLTPAPLGPRPAPSQPRHSRPLLHLQRTLAALTGNRHSVHSACRRGKHFGENGAKPGRVDRKSAFCAFYVSTRQWRVASAAVLRREEDPPGGLRSQWEVRSLRALRSHCSLRPLPPFPASPLRGNLSPAGPVPLPVAEGGHAPGHLPLLPPSRAGHPGNLRRIRLNPA